MASELDEHVALLEKSLANIENDYRPTCETVNYGNGCPGATDASRDFWRRAVDCVPVLIAHYRHLPRPALTDEEREALELVRHAIANERVVWDYRATGRVQVALAVLDRLLSGAVK